MEDFAFLAAEMDNKYYCCFLWWREVLKIGNKFLERPAICLKRWASSGLFYCVVYRFIWEKYIAPYQFPLRNVAPDLAYSLKIFLHCRRWRRSCLQYKISNYRLRENIIPIFAILLVYMETCCGISQRKLCLLMPHKGLKYVKSLVWWREWWSWFLPQNWYQLVQIGYLPHFMLSFPKQP